MEAGGGEVDSQWAVRLAPEIWCASHHKVVGGKHVVGPLGQIGPGGSSPSLAPWCMCTAGDDMRLHCACAPGGW